MKLFYNQIELDSSVENELFANSEYGFDVDVVYEEKFLLNNEIVDMYKYNGYYERFHNCTEVHHLYKGILNEMRIAFESDIHSTGCTRDISHIKFVHVMNSNRKSIDFT